MAAAAESSREFRRRVKHRHWAGGWRCAGRGELPSVSGDTACLRGSRWPAPPGAQGPRGPEGHPVSPLLPQDEFLLLLARGPPSSPGRPGLLRLLGRCRGLGLALSLNLE